MQLRPIDRIRADAFGEFERAGEPVVIEGTIGDWPAIGRWDPASLVARIGDVAIRSKFSTTGRHPDFHGAMFATRSGTFRELVDAMTSGPPGQRGHRMFTGDEKFVMRCRDGHTTIDEDLRPLLDDVRIPTLVPRDRLYTVWAWFSGRGARTWLHYDNNGCHNLNAQITGTKQCVLLAPRTLARVAPFPLGGPNPAHNCSSLDLDASDPDACRELADVDGITARLVPGDLLFIPAWWFHAFAHLGDFNSNINFWWKPVRPTLDVVAARQMLIDAAAQLDPADPAVAAVLGQLDRAAIARTGV